MGFLFIIITTITDGVQLGMVIPLADIVLGGKEIAVNKELPLFLDKLISYLNSIPRLRLLNMMGGAIIVLIVLKGIARYGQEYFMQKLGLKVVRDIRNFMFEKYHGLSLDFFARSKAGNLASRVVYDPSVIQDTLSLGVSDLILQTLRVILFTVVIFTMDWKLSLLILLVTPLIALPIVRIGRALRKVSLWAQEKMADINSTLYETITGVKIIKAFNMQGYEIEKFKSYNHRFFKIGVKSVKRMAAISPISEFFGTIAAVVVLIIGGREVIKGNVSFGIFICYLGFLLSLIRPINRLARVHGINQKALAAAERIFDVLDTTATVKDHDETVTLEKYSTDIAYCNVWFNYDEDESVLKNINFNVKKGEIIAIVGPTGSGKSSTVNLLPRFYDPTEGKILIDGKDIKHFSLHSLRDKIAVVTQDIILFNDTVKANISYGSHDAKDEEIIAASKDAFAHDFISSMPHGYNTVIGDRGFRLSGGEKQRIAVARAMLKNAPILILDEATSHLDTESEKIMQRAIDRLMFHKTVFVIAHRLSTVKKASNILVLDKGEIAQFGTHEGLLKEGGLYKRLYSLQFSDVEM